MKERILGVDVHCVTMGSAVAMGLELLDTPGTHRCYTPNPKLLSMAREDEELRHILNGADLSLPDGVGVLLAARLTGKFLKERVAGADFALALAKAAGERGKAVYLLGGAPGVAERAGEALKKACPGLVLAGTADGYFADPGAAADRVRRTGAELVYVCLGCPKQERWIARYGERTGAGLLAGLGGTLDVLAGDIKRAPKPVQRLGLEWLWRAACQPRRMRELWRLPDFLAAAVRERNEGNGRKVDRP